MMLIRKPQYRPWLYYSGLMCTVIEHCLAIFFIYTLSKETMTFAIGVLIAIVISTWTLTMWSIIADLYRRGNIVLMIVASLVLNIPAFIYDLHGALAFTSNMNREYEDSTVFAQQEKSVIQSQELVSKTLSESIIKPTDIAKRNTELTELSNKFSANKTHCKNQWGKCAKDIDRRIENNKEEMEANNKLILLAGNSISALQSSQTEVNKIMHGDNDWKKTHEAFQIISRLMNDGDPSFAKKWQSTMLSFFAVFVVCLLMLNPFFADLLCFDYTPQSRRFAERAPATTAQRTPATAATNNRASMTAPPSQTAAAAPAPRTAPITAHIADFAQLITRRNEAAREERGTGELREFDDTIITPAVVNTTSPTLSIGSGFFARHVPNPDYIAPPAAVVTAPVATPTPAVNRSQIATPPAVIRQHQATLPPVVVNLVKTKKKRAATNRGTSPLVSYNEIAAAIKEGRLTRVSTRGLNEFVRSISIDGSGMGNRTAAAVIAKLKTDGVIK